MDASGRFVAAVRGASVIHFYSQWRGLHGHVRPAVVVSARLGSFEVWLRPLSFRARLGDRHGIQISGGRGYFYVGDVQLDRIHYQIGGPS